MTRPTTPDGRTLPALFFDYARQCWVKSGVIRDCNHPRVGTFITNAVAGTRTAWRGCACYGRLHAGERWTPLEEGSTACI